ncbi:MAG: ATP-dependent Clp protease adaptor ClpS [Desulfovibrionaceae bacterium]|nr:ATP-dependent Clp protease adaptor ClpS [Desulfovibrionaceae bacterium]
MPTQTFSTPGTDTADVAEPEIKEPPLYAVYLHNDDYTTMDFVVLILKEIFFMNEEKAIAVMLKVHQEGVAKCGTYVKEIAATKRLQVTRQAQKAGFPLLCTIEEE